ncbi:endoplasmic reticulum membrane-associated RNA degradation protein-like [Styela clava]
MLSSINTFLSPNVKYLVCDLVNETADLGLSYTQKPTKDEVLKSIGTIISSIELGAPATYLEALRAISPYAKLLHPFKLNNTENHTETWLSTYTMVSFQTIFMVEKPAQMMLALLKFTSALERALGDACVSLGGTCPFLLRDLLLDDGLWKLFGANRMKLLQVLIGNPHGINLRNLVWHGFLGPAEIPHVFVSLLLCICESLASVLNLHEDKIQQRPLISDSYPMQLFRDRLQCTSLLKDVDKIWRCISDSHICPVLWPFLEESFNLYAQKEFGDCVTLIIPCFETWLRILFAQSNDCEERILTAESSSLYTTLDEILAQHLDDGSENRIRFVLGDEIMMVLMDLFVLQDGVRIRDRLSHGEMSLAIIKSQIASVLICLTLRVLWCLTREQKWNTLDEAALGECLEDGTHEDCFLKRFATSFDNQLKGYCSLFHPLNIAKRSYLKSKATIEQFKYVQTPEVFHSDAGDSGTFQDVGDAPYIAESALLYRSDKKYLEIVVVLCHITDESLTSANNVLDYLHERWQSFCDRSLRSRQRVNYKNMVNRLSEIQVLFVTILREISRHFLDLEQIDVPDHNAFLRKLKRLLKTTENLRTLTSQNKWDEVCSLLSRFV